jgi:hypothetical protein
MHKFTFLLTLSLLLSASAYKCKAQNDYILIGSSSPFITIVNLKDTMIFTIGGNGGQKFSIDLDKNQVSDLYFSIYSHVGTGQHDGGSSISTRDGCTFQPQFGKGYIAISGTVTVVDSFSTIIPKIFNSSDTLFADSCKLSGASFTNYESRDNRPTYQYTGQWVSGVHYVGFKKIVNNKAFLGWVKLEVKSSEIIFKEYAIQTLPVGIEEIRASSAAIYPNPTTGEFTVKDVVYKTVELYNATGEKVLTLENGNTTNGSIDVHDLAQGIYFVKIVEQGKEGYFIKKLIKQ